LFLASSSILLILLVLRVFVVFLKLYIKSLRPVIVLCILYQVIKKQVFTPQTDIFLLKAVFLGIDKINIFFLRT